LEHAADILQDGRILWVDDHPELNLPIIRLLEQVGMTVDTARSTAEGLSLLRRRAYDIVITDMERDNEDSAEAAGVVLLDELGREVTLPIIVYAARFDPTRGVHRRIFAYTNRADDVVQYVIDLMERIKFRAM
jgi:CheY-like chemotaxis protein